MFSVANKSGNVTVVTVQVLFSIAKEKTFVEEGNSSSHVSNPENWLLNCADGIVGNVRDVQQSTVTSGLAMFTFV